jgi:hypothetical protein
MLVEGYQLKELLGESNLKLNDEEIDSVDELGLNN